ncbi:MAG: phosphate acetyltransferase [Lentisphaeria bacterium]|nr:phosphate acetyltransferase [Lentisphaeria bacterium]
MEHHTLLVVPVNSEVGLTTISLGLIRAFERQMLRVGFCKPIAQPKPGENIDIERSVALVNQVSDIASPPALAKEHAQEMLSDERSQELMEEVVAICTEAAANKDVLIVEGLAMDGDLIYDQVINSMMAKSLNAQLVLVGEQKDKTPEEMAEIFIISAAGYGHRDELEIAGCILNRVPLPVSKEANDITSLMGKLALKDDISKHETSAYTEALDKHNFHTVGLVPYRPRVSAPRVIDLVHHLKCRVYHEGNWKKRRILSVKLCGRSIPRVLEAFTMGAVIVLPADRFDVLLAASLAVLKGTQIACVVLTGIDDHELSEEIRQLCRPALEKGMPLLGVKTNSFDTTLAIKNLPSSLPLDDIVRIEETMNTVANHIDDKWVYSFAGGRSSSKLSPPAFRHKLIEQVRKKPKRIVLPEGTDERTVHAAILCQERGLANCVILGKEDEVRTLASGEGCEIPKGLEILDPDSLADKYVDELMRLRQHKGLTFEVAMNQLQDPVVAGTMMLKMGHVDGLVSGAINTTANTIRPALQLIKTKPGSNIVSSVFFMCLPDQVVVYGDCAVNPDPTAEQLAEIAIDSADSARQFGINPRVAMISYSTGTSGAGADVDKVAKATEIVREKRPDIEIDGPLQYDAASVKEVAAKKAPNSSVAGKATVFVFPDLNTGNTTYKAVQRSAHVVSMGPMLQGLAKPVNDLSRGALVEDIVYTIVLTAIQSEESI